MALGLGHYACNEAAPLVFALMTVALQANCRTASMPDWRSGKHGDVGSCGSLTTVIDKGRKQCMPAGSPKVWLTRYNSSRL